MGEFQRCACLWTFVLAALTITPASAGASGTVTNCTESALLTALAGGGSVLISCDSAIALSQTIVIAKETVLDGTGHTASLTSGQTTNFTRLFLVQPGASLTLRHLTLTGVRVVATNTSDPAQGEFAFGAAIYIDRGVVNLDGCTLSDNHVTGAVAPATTSTANGGNGGSGLGAAIYNVGGSLTVTNTVFSGNGAAGGAGAKGATWPGRRQRRRRRGRRNIQHGQWPREGG